jgi:hypothetical protein
MTSMKLITYPISEEIMQEKGQDRIGLRDRIDAQDRIALQNRSQDNIAIDDLIVQIEIRFNRSKSKKR